MPDPTPRSIEEIKAALEALIYVSEEPVQEEELLSVFPAEAHPQVVKALSELMMEYSAVPRGLRIIRVAGGYRMQTGPEYSSYIRSLYRQRNRVRLSRAALETLAIIAYRQPVTTPEIQSIRGTNPMGVLQTLLERGLIRVLGRKKVVGKPILYGTTREFLVHFGLNRLEDLPSLEDFGIADSGGDPDPEAISRSLDELLQEELIPTAASVERSADGKGSSGTPDPDSLPIPASVPSSPPGRSDSPTPPEGPDDPE